MFTCYRDYEEWLEEQRVQEALDSMVAPNMKDAVELAELNHNG